MAAASSSVQGFTVDLVIFHLQSQGDHNLANLSVRLHIAVGFDDFSEEKSLIDERLESA
jgi:hypothetical protein